MTDEDKKITRINKDYSGFEYEDPYIKILDKSLDLTENQFVEYLNRQICFNHGRTDDFEIVVHDAEIKEGNLLRFSFMIEKSLTNLCLDNRYYLLAGLFDRFGSITRDESFEEIGYLKVYNTRSEPPRFVLMVKQYYSGKIKHAVEEMLTELHLNESNTDELPAPNEHIQKFESKRSEKYGDGILNSDHFDEKIRRMIYLWVTKGHDQWKNKDIFLAWCAESNLLPEDIAEMPTKTFNNILKKAGKYGLIIKNDKNRWIPPA